MASDKKAGYKGLKHAEAFHSSPFIEITGLYVTEQRDRGLDLREVWDTKTGEQRFLSEPKKGRAGFFVSDNAKYVKLFTAEDQMIDFGELSAVAVKLLIYIMKVLKPLQEEVFIDVQSFSRACGYKGAKPIYNGLFELCEKKIIAKKTGPTNIFFINPNKLFNGSRSGLPDAEFRSGFRSALYDRFYESRSGPRPLPPNTDFHPGPRDDHK